MSTNSTKMLQNVATQSSVGTPRAINEDILDQGYTVEGNALINHLSVQSSHADKMRADPKAVYFQLGASVCNNPGVPQTDGQGRDHALRLHRGENQPSGRLRQLQESDCPKAGQAKKK